MVSVILPTYNRAQLLGRSIRSVLSQTFSDFELIVVDDASTDNTEELVKSFQDPRIRFIRHHINRGASAARNTGINAAQGKYIAFEDSDDEWLPYKLERQMALFKQDKKGDLGLVLCEVLAPGPHGEGNLVPQIQMMTYDNLLLHQADVGYSTIQFLIKRDLTKEELHFDEDLSTSEEWELLLRLVDLCRIDYVPEVLARIHTDSIDRMTNPNNALKSRLIILEKYNAELKKRPKALRSTYFDLAIRYYRANEAMSYVRRYLKAAIKARPAHPTAYVGLAFSALGRQGFWLFIKLQGVLSARLKQLVVFF